MGTTKVVDAGDIIIISHWPRQQAGEEHIGFGFSRNYLLYNFLSIPMGIAISWFIAPRLRPVLSQGQQFAISVLPMIILPLLFTPARRRAGFYILDEQGNAVTFLKKWSPAYLKGRMGVSRKEFFARSRQLV